MFVNLAQVHSEYTTCKSSLEYFATHYCRVIRHDSKHAVLLSNEYITKWEGKDQALIDTTNARQIGGTSYLAAKCLHTLLFSDNKVNISLFTIKIDNGKELYFKIRTMMTGLPEWFQSFFDIVNMSMIKMKDGNSLRFCIYKDTHVRGTNPTHLYFNDVNTIDREFLDALLPVIKSDTKIFAIGRQVSLLQDIFRNIVYTSETKLELV